MPVLGKRAERAYLFLSFLTLFTPTSAQNAQGLHSLAVAAGKLFFGTATDTNHFDDTAYLQIVNNTAEFGLVVPENSLKWEVTEPTSGDFVFTGGDGVLGLARANKQIFRCHTLTWHSQLPSFGTLPDHTSQICLSRLC
jgi:GH35 family endo-1,4-beta-xylanase